MLERISKKKKKESGVKVVYPWCYIVNFFLLVNKINKIILSIRHISSWLSFIFSKQSMTLNLINSCQLWILCQKMNHSFFYHFFLSSHKTYVIVAVVTYLYLEYSGFSDNLLCMGP